METTNGKVEILVSKAKEDRTNTNIGIQRFISDDVISSADTSRQASLDDQHDDHQYVSDERHCLASLTSSSHRRIQSDPITDSRLASWSSSLSDKPVVTTTPSRHDSTESEQRDTFGEASVSQVRPTLVPPSLPASLHRRIHSDPLTDTQLAYWGSQDERCFAISTTTSDPTTSRNMTTTTSDVSCGLRPLVTSPAGVAAASSHGNSATDMNNTSADGSSGLVQIGDGAFVSQRVYELMMGSNAANGTQQVERSLGGRGMSKLLGLAGRLPNILHRDPPRRVYTTDSADSSDMTSPPPPPVLLSRRTVLSKLSVGLLGRQMSLPAHSFAAASADCVAAATHQGSTSLDNSVCSESGIPCEKKESMVEVASGVFANAEDDGSIVVGGHRSHFAPMLASIPSDCDSTRGDDVNILDVCPSSAASEPRTLDVTDGVEVVTDELPVDDVTVDIETAASEMCNDGSDEVVIDGLEEEVKMRKHRSGSSGKGRKLPYGGVQHSLSDSSINANQDKPPLSRPRSLESLTFSDRLDAAGPSSGSAGDVAALDRPLPGVPLRGPRSTAERVAYTATQPIRRVIQTLMRRAHTDDDFSATVASLHRTPANAEIEAQVNTQVDGSIASSYLWREQQPGTYNNSESGSPSSSTQMPRTANHRRSLSFSGRLALLTERKAANCDTTIDDLVASGCSIQGISSSLSTPVCTSPLSHALTGGSDTGSPLLLSSSDSPIINYSRRGTGTSSLTDPSGSPASSNVAGVDGTAKTRTVQFADMSATTSSITRVNAECERDRQHRHQQQYHLASSDLQRKVADDIVRSDSRSSVDRPMSAASRLSPRLGKGRTSAASILSTTSSNFKHVAASDSKASDRYSVSMITGSISSFLRFFTRQASSSHPIVIILSIVMVIASTLVNWQLMSMPKREANSSPLMSMYTDIDSHEDYRRLLILEASQLTKRVSFLEQMVLDTRRSLKEVQQSLKEVDIELAEAAAKKHKKSKQSAAPCCACPGDVLSKQPDPAKDLSKQPDPAKDLRELPDPAKDLTKLPDPAKDLSVLPDAAEDLSKQPGPAKDLSELPDPAEDLSKQPDPAKDLSKLPDPAEDLSKLPDNDASNTVLTTATPTDAPPTEERTTTATVATATATCDATGDCSSSSDPSQPGVTSTQSQQSNPQQRLQDQESLEADNG